MNNFGRGIIIIFAIFTCNTTVLAASVDHPFIMRSLNVDYTASITSEVSDTDQAINVKSYGAKGDGITNDTEAIQKAFDENTSVYIPDGTYMINVDQTLKPKSNQTITLSQNAVLKAFPSANGYHAVIRMTDVSNISISGGAIVGERYEHLGIDGEWGMGIQVINGSSNIKIMNMTISDCWGDGIFLGDSPAVTDITIDQVICDNNRRQGLSITDANRITITNSVFKNTNGTLPEAGIDVEPEEKQTAENIRIINSQCIGNNGSGLDLMGLTGTIQFIEVTNSVIKDNKSKGIRLYNANYFSINDTEIKNNGLDKIQFDQNSYRKTLSRIKTIGLYIIKRVTGIHIENL